MQRCLCWRSTRYPAQVQQKHSWICSHGFHLGFFLFKQKLDKAAAGFLGSIATHGNNWNYEAKHICTKHYETHWWDSFKQLISCQCSLLCSPTCIETRWSERIVNKGRAELSIPFPRLLLLPIPFLLFSTCLILTTHCCFYFGYFEILFPSSGLIPVGSSSYFPQVECFFQLHSLGC